MSYLIDEDVAEAIREILRKEHEDYAKGYEAGRRDYEIEQKIQKIGRAVERAYTTSPQGNGKYKSVETVIPQAQQPRRQATVLPKPKASGGLIGRIRRMFGGQA